MEPVSKTPPMYVYGMSEKAQAALRERGFVIVTEQWPFCPLAYQLPPHGCVRWALDGVVLEILGLRLRAFQDSLYMDDEITSDFALDLDTWDTLAVRLYELLHEDREKWVFANEPLKRQWEFHKTVYIALSIKQERIAQQGKPLPLNGHDRYEIGERIFHYVSCVPGSFMPSLRGYPASMVEEYCRLFEQVLTLEETLRKEGADTLNSPEFKNDLD